MSVVSDPLVTVTAHREPRLHLEKISAQALHMMDVRGRPLTVRWQHPGLALGVVE